MSTLRFCGLLWKPAIAGAKREFYLREPLHVQASTSELTLVLASVGIGQIPSAILVRRSRNLARCGYPLRRGADRGLKFISERSPPI